MASPEIPASAALWPRIESAIAEVPRAAANDNRSMVSWRAGAIAASLVAVAMSGVALRPGSREPMPMPGSVAALSSQGGAPAVLVAYDKSRGMLKVVPMAMVPQAGHSLQLWLIAGRTAPRPMGILTPGMPAMIRKMPLDPAAGPVFAVSVEPIGGSPTGLPTGRIAWSGRMMAVSPET
jgi:anti-sigma-K factor RskA